MGFPKPWPTEWPEPTMTPLLDEPPEELPEVDPDETGEPQPEYRHRSCSMSSVTWAVNHACNLRCTHCYDVVPDRRRDLDTADALAVIDRLYEAGVRFIAFSGGEAFLRRDLFELMGHAVSRGMKIGARSNATRITPIVAERLRELGVSGRGRLV